LGLLYDQARRIWFYRWLIVLVAVPLFAGAAFFIMRMPKIYEAYAQVFVDRETAAAAAAEHVSLVGGNFGSGYVIQKTMLNDNNLHALLFRINPAARNMDRGSLANATAGLRGRIRIDPDQGDGFFQIHYQDTDPVRARDVVKMLIDGFINANLARNRVELESAVRFLDRQIASYASSLQEANKALAQFRALHPEIVDARNPMVVANAASAVASARAAYEAALAQPSRGGGNEGEIASLRAHIAELRGRFTDQYPDVVAAQHRLDVLLAAGAAAPAPSTNEGVVAQARAQLDAAEGRLRSAERSAAGTVLDAQWADLRNNAEILRNNRQELMGRRQGAQMSLALYADRESGKYQVTTPPVVPPLPVGPNRRLYLALAAGIALAVGIGAAYLRAAVNGIFVAPRELEEAFGLPVAGTVSLERAWQTRAIASMHHLALIAFLAAGSLAASIPPSAGTIVHPSTSTAQYWI
ncbi:MAG TPA: hypothetical protein VFS01_08465, partial [Rhizomicrobium sp.]|nr:hypothetical protein [Rhizomicrobium sp.]